jgi:hypothetical protein
MMPHPTLHCHIVAMESIVFKIVPYAAYRLDLPLSDFWWFAALKKYIKGIHCTNDVDVQAAKLKWLRAQCEGFYNDGFKKLV